MLNKLLKYDLKYMLKNMSVFYILALFFAILTRILFSLEETAMIKIISQISVGCMFSMCASILINTLMRSWVRFRDSIYKDEAYLTHTLPVTKNDIYNSKFIQTLIFFLVNFIIIILCLFITYYTEERWILLKDILNKVTIFTNSSISLVLIIILLILFLEIFNGLQSGYLGILLGHRKNNNKIGFSVLFGFISYLLSQGVLLVILYIIALFNGDIMSLFKSSSEAVLSISTFKLLAVLTAVIYTIIIITMNIVCKKTFNKGVNIE